ncbi:MAG: hypothetical protein ACKOPG_04390 [Novosphingobium sp.]
MKRYQISMRLIDACLWLAVIVFVRFGLLHNAPGGIIVSNPDPVVQFVNGFGIAIILLGIFGALSFVCIDKWRLWRDAG